MVHMFTEETICLLPTTREKINHHTLAETYLANAALQGESTGCRWKYVIHVVHYHLFVPK